MAEAATTTRLIVLLSMLLVLHSQTVPSPAEAPSQGSGLGSGSGSGSGSPPPPPPRPQLPQPPQPPLPPDVPRSQCCVPLLCGFRTFHMAFYVHFVKEPASAQPVSVAPLLGQPASNTLCPPFGYSEVFDDKLTFAEDYGSSECGRLQGFLVTDSTSCTSDISFQIKLYNYDGYLKVTGCHNFSSTINKYIINGGTESFKGAEGTCDTYEVSRYGPRLLNHVDYCLIRVKIDPQGY